MPRGAPTLEKIGTLPHDTGNPAQGTRYWEAALVVFDERPTRRRPRCVPGRY
ncbi:hypothetical protein [Amycolatopsis sp. NBC_01286]|uniref:hypothetical protein n=1 Tax=Amycolatopsis sp. NBC_01286 TaxID=2903560 RepID=UPI002E0E0EFE|nr:hypothetical protein OG570_29135 [Amycolatopsis sp. NBC_01286]